jgi:O-methyltransferase involved in polyketide biosynthesis
MTTPDLQGISRTLLVPLACRALESIRSDAIISDPQAVKLYQSLGGNKDFLMGMSGHDLFATVMRVRQFDSFARTFLGDHPDGLVVDIGCGLDTRFNRLDDSRMSWYGVDLPEVISLRRHWLPDTRRSKTIAQSMLEYSWLDEISGLNKHTIFLAEGVFPYFSTAEVKPLILEMAARFPSAELVFDAISPSLSWFHNLTSSVLKSSKTRVLWDAKNPSELESWGLQLLERWDYFDKPEPRLKIANLIRYFPPLAHATYILHYRLGNSNPEYKSEKIIIRN